jgi:hypothetical protein
MAADLAQGGAPSFAAPALYAVPNYPSSVVVADFNGDGRPDVAVTEQDAARVAVMLNQGNRVLGAPATFAVGTSPIDIVVATAAGNQVAVLLNTH